MGGYLKSLLGKDTHNGTHGERYGRTYVEEHTEGHTEGQEGHTRTDGPTHTDIGGTYGGRHIRTYGGIHRGIHVETHGEISTTSNQIAT